MSSRATLRDLKGPLSSPKKSGLIVLLLTVLLVNISGFFPLGRIGLVASGCLLAAVVVFRAYEVISAVLLSFLLGFLPLLLPKTLFEVPATGFRLPFAFTASVLLLLPFTWGGASFSWVRIGKSDGVTRALVFLTSILATLALLGWAFWTDNLGDGEKMMASFAVYPNWAIVVAGIPAFALVNAFAEEVVYRGVLQEVLHRVIGSTIGVITLQASAFAAAHVLVGFPNGCLGYLMVFVYGTMLGYLRIRSNGMLGSYLTHVLADLTIGYFLCFHWLGGK
jgi:membrane protease YdiL (CAAX protease family)